MVSIAKKDKLFDFGIYLILLLVIVMCVFPLLYVVSVSFTPMAEVQKNGGFLVIPRSFTLDAYQAIIKQNQLGRAMLITVFVTLGGTVFSMIFSVLIAYPLSKEDLPGRKVIMTAVVFTMMFGGGTIPTYLLIKSLGMIGSYWALIIPGCISTYNMIVIKSFFENMPGDLFESAEIDGASHFRILAQIVVPLSKPVLMTVMLFYAVGYWETYFSAIMYLPDQNMQTLQVVLRRMLTPNPEMNAETVVPTMTLQMAAVVFSSVPIVLVYPFIQKYFTKGIMLGAVKG